MLQPIARKERYEILDVARGFALFGVLVANLFANLSFAGPKAHSAPLIAALDAAAATLIAFFISTKFISIFAFLFGYGFAIQAQRASARGTSIVPTYSRRLLWLLVFGLTHAFLLWWGDILASYAVGGFLLLACRRWPDAKLRRWGLSLTMIGITLLVARPWIVKCLDQIGDPMSVLRQVNLAGLGRASEIFASGSPLEFPAANATLVGFLTFSGILPVHFVLSCGLFLVGLAAGRSGLLIRNHPEDRLVSWRNYGLLAGVVGHAVWVLAPRWHLVDLRSSWTLAVGPLAAIGVLGMSIFYISSLALLHRSPRWRSVVTPFATVGRTALTNYLAQSALYVVLLYGVGLGLIQTAGPALAIPLAILIFAAQTILSRWWLKRFDQGPVEWLWRRLTYGHPA